MDTHAREISLTKQTRASYDAYLDALPILLSRHEVFAQRWCVSGEKWMRVQFAGCTFGDSRFLEADGTSHTVDPHTCRLRNLTYSIPLYTDIHVHRSNGASSVLSSVYLGRIPLMVGSKRCKGGQFECPYDQGGYFIVNGSEKTVVNQKAHVHNTMLTLHRVVNGNPHWAITCKSECDMGVMVTTVKWQHVATITFPKLQHEIPVGVLLRHLPPPQFVTLSPEETAFYAQTLHADGDVVPHNTFHVGEPDEERVRHVLDYCLPHTDFKADFLLLMLRQLRLDMLTDTWADRDSLLYQRIEMVSDLLTSLTHHLLRKMCHDLKMFLHRKLTGDIRDNTLLKQVGRVTTLTDGLQYALGTGNWTTLSFDNRQRVGVAQLLQRGTFFTAMSQFRRISSSIKPEQKLSKPRYIHGTHRGRLCFVESPEGASCGLESQLAVGAYISIASPVALLQDLIRGHPGDTLVFINGALQGRYALEVVDVIRAARRTGQIAKDVSVCHRNGVHIRCNSGRICRPLFILPVRLKRFDEMLTQGCVEYVDVYEEDTLVIGDTHAEIDEAMLMGLCGGTIPYSDRNPGPRLCYQAAMMKQAQGLHALNYYERFDTTTNVLHYGQRPICSTKMERAYNFDLPMGQNAIVAIMPFEYNQEDSIVMNKGAIDRGFGRCTTFKTVKDVRNDADTYCKPTPKRRCAYDVGANGLPYVNQHIKRGDCLIGKSRTVRTGGKKRAAEEIDCSVLCPRDAVVDRILCYKERSGNDAVKVRLRIQRVPTVGDKYASRSSQKGTIGMVFPQEDMPFTLDGICPDIIMNPHAIPSRMTCAQILESVKSKYGCYAGLQDASPYNGDTAEGLMGMLAAMGFKGNGTERMINGITGKMYDVPIFIGPTFYQRLKHNSADKLHARARGRLDTLSRQPNSGRQQGGGLRVGEMEKDTFVAHTVPFVLTERLMHSSDAYDVEVCPACGQTHSLRGGVCKTCRVPSTTRKMPYAFALLRQELAAMCVNIQLK